ncbi:hypothetical protein Pcinc_018796 [Petrolisthes cinctipes]|uniref:Uncharacterized protein n=1 Tax=Petrolisthes cinctipes TaxID=88211 RepID=A0AAE1KIL2_PETCI|nr:hypothetical protein Pcinc_018796 [Petrolisthes cinctipes]
MEPVVNVLSHRNTLPGKDEGWTRLPQCKDSSKTVLDDMMMQGVEEEEEEDDDNIYMETSKALLKTFYKDAGQPNRIIEKGKYKPRSSREVKYNRCLDRVVEYLLTRNPKYLGYVKINFSEEMERIKKDKQEGWEERLKQYQELHNRLQAI